MTLSRFLRDYLYIPLGGSRIGALRRYLNLAVTMVLGGMWHGAGWNFALWGGLHAAYLMLNHLWRALLGRPPGYTGSGPAGRLAGCAMTFLAVAVAWVPFRAADMETTAAMLSGLAGLHGMGVVSSLPLVVLLPPLLAVVWFAPNTQVITGYTPPGEWPSDDAKSGQPHLCRTWLHWRPSPIWAFGLGALFALALLSLSKVSEFLYFQF